MVLLQTCFQTNFSLKIIFPSVFYLPHVVGGIEYYIQNLAKGLLLKGHDVKIAVPEFDDGPKGDYEYDGLQIIRYKGFTSVGKLQMSGLQANESLHHFKALLRREKPDIVHFSQITNSSGISLQHIAAPKEFGAKVVYTNHMAEFICQRGDFMYMGKTSCDGIVTVKKCTTCLLHTRGLNKAAANITSCIDNSIAKLVGQQNYLRQVTLVTLPGFSTRWHIHKVKSVISTADTFISIAEWCTGLLKQNNWYSKNCVTVKTGLLNSTSVKLKTLAEYDGYRPFKIICVARIFPVKGIDLLIKAVKGIDKTAIELNIYCPAVAVNESGYYNLCRDLAKENPNIFFHPEAKNSEVVALMSQNDILCIPSKGNEMAPLVIQEAMAAGIPVIGADLPAVKEWITDGYNGLIFPVNNGEALTRKLQTVINNPHLLYLFKTNLQAPRAFAQVVNEYNNLYQYLFTNS